MEIKNLAQTPLHEIVACFNRAFSDYFVPIAATEEAMEKRWRAGRVDYSLSFGAFDQGKLVAFIITGVDRLNGLKTAYNAGTGVIPEYRGQRLVEKLYEVALPAFKVAGIKQSTLEVITQNEKAIKAYQKVGFQIVRTLHCFKGNLLTDPENFPVNGYAITRTSEIDFNLLAPLQPYEFSWDNRNEGVSMILPDLECWLLHQRGILKGYVLLNPATGYLAQLGFSAENIPFYGKLLFREIARQIPAVRINNVDSRAQEIYKLLETVGLENNLDQFEMLLKLPA
ncbi:GNAT family N-acetyltransferase [Adhaeribacter soli]|uniref:GNAT family N-acetyltransferase n=1 Tax=Adhaeribacter soli TaxID=2607655 RepID=A0A5N1J9P2_9BACT|nr:GNAT family N-acetyltransferase [Adhaeribacter soli]KAA9345549.1 GNAT family N-acetyltransferase [Adhaeribacter soli]